jgi:hypothetical protein
MHGPESKHKSFFVMKTNQMHYLALIYFVNPPQHALNMCTHIGKREGAKQHKQKFSNIKIECNNRKSTHRKRTQNPRGKSLLLAI